MDTAATMVPPKLALSSLAIVDKPTLDQLNSSRETMDLANKHVSKKVCEWFESWCPWQQRMLMCGLTDRCSNSHLETLATTLEPVFHRDFLANLKQRYPSAPFRLMKERELLKLRRENERRLAEGYRDEFHLLYPDAMPKMTDQDLPMFNGLMVEQTTGSESEDMEPEAKEPEAEETEEPTLTANEELNTFARQLSARLIVKAYNTLRDQPELFQSVMVLDSRSSRGSQPTSPQILAIESPKSSRASSPGEEENEGDRQEVESTEQPTAERPLSIISEEHSGSPAHSLASPAPPAVQAEASQSPVLSTDSTTLGSRSRPESIRDPLAEAPRKQNKKPLKDELTSDLPAIRIVAPHRHRSAIGTSSDVATVDFFLGDERMEKLGFMQREIRRGPVQKPRKVRDLCLPLQRCYKPVKFCSSSNEGKTYVRAHRGRLRRQFKRQLGQVWQWIRDWQDYERMQLLSDVTKLCNAALLEYLCHCLTLRLRDRTDIQRLQDSTLMHVFSFLPPADIEQAGRVCKRWRYVCSLDELWMSKCRQVGREEGVPNLTEIIQKSRQRNHKRIDWKLAYLEMLQLNRETKQAANRDMQRVEDRTPEGMMRVDGKLVPIVDEDTRTVSVQSSLPKRRMTTSTVLAVKRGTVFYLRDELAGLRLIDEGEEDDSDSFVDTDEYSIFKEESKTLKSKGKARKPSPSHGSSFDVTGRTRYDHMREHPSEQEYDLSERSGSRHQAARRRKRRESGEEPALDVRPELRQARDLLNKSVSAHRLVWKEERKAEAKLKVAKFAGEVKSVQRVRKLQGHLDSVLCIAISKRRLISGSMDRSIRIWDLSSGKSIHKLYGHLGGVRCLHFKKQILVSGSWDMQVMVWDLLKFERKCVLTGHRGSISCIEFNDKYLLTGSHDKTLRVWYMNGFLLHTIIEGHTKAVTCLAIDGENVVSGSSDKTIRLTNMYSGECLQVFDGLQEHVLTMCVRNDLIISGNAQGQCYFINKATRDVEAAVQVHRGPVNMVVTHNNRFYTASGDSTVKEWDLGTMTCVRYLQGPRGPIRDLKVDDRRIISCGEDGNIRIWDIMVPEPKRHSAEADVVPSAVVKRDLIV